MPKCPICLAPSQGLMCHRCGVAYDRFMAGRSDDGTMQAVIEWVARRTRRFERKRFTAVNERDFLADMRAALAAREDGG